MNDVKLQEGHPVDENLRPIKVGGEATALEVSKKDVRVNNLYVNGTTTGVSASDSTKLPLTGGAMTGAITTNSTFDGIDIATRDAILTSTTTTANAALPKAGGTMTGDITTDSNIVSTDLTIDDSGDIELNAAGGDIVMKKSLGQIASFEGGDFYLNYNATNYFRTTITSNGAAVIKTIGGTPANADYHLDVGGDITLDSGTGVFIAKNAGTEFSAANSSYAGMILGYTDIGLDEAAATYNLTTGYVVPTSEFKVTFTIPPSGNVEIFIQIGLDLGSGNNGDLYAGLSTASSYTQLEDFHEVEIFDGMSRGALRAIRHSWTLTGLTSAGDEEEIWVGFKSSSTLGTPHLQWGSNASDATSDFIMKAIALPATIGT